MLPTHLWNDNEPRFGFPVFAECINRVSQAVRIDFCRFNWKKAVKQSLTAIKQRRVVDPRIFLPLITKNTSAMTVRGVLATQRGEFVEDFGALGKWSAGQAFEINVNELLASRGLPITNATFLLIMNLGEHAEALSDINIFSMSYEGKSFFANYRTGAFARTLNDFAKKKHAGFMSVNPKVIVNDRFISSLLFINHSSNLSYNDAVSPHVRIYRQDGRHMDAEFGPVPAFGWVERSIEEIFGKEAGDFLKPSGGLGTTISRVKGYTLAGISILRSRDGKSMSIEHTRPTQSYLINGI